MMTQNISANLERNLLDLSEVAHSAGSRDLDKLNKIKETTLTEINNEINSLTFVGQAMLEQIKANLEQNEWDKLPPANELKIQLKALKELTEAVVANSAYIAIDINAILSMLLEFQRKAALAKNESKIMDKELFIKSANAEIESKKAAALKQLTADLVSAATQIVTGSIQLIAGGVALGRSLSSAFDAKIAKDLANMKNKVQDMKDTLSDLNKTKAALISNQDITKLPDARIKSISTRIDIVEGNIKIKEGKIEKWINKTEKEGIGGKYEIKTNSEIDSFNRITDGGMAMTNALNSYAKGMGDAIAASIRFEAKMDETEAEQFALSKNLASSAEQTSLDSYQQIRDTLRSIVQTLSAFEQSMNSSFSSMAAKI